MGYREFDAVIIGSGVGGCSVAYRLCLSGKKVLILEKGGMQSADTQTIDEEIIFHSNGGKKISRQVPLAKRPGGNSTIYGAQLSRFDKTYFQNDDLNGKKFPFKYSDIKPYYSEVEHLFATKEPSLSHSDEKMVVAFNDCGFDSAPCLNALGFVKGCDGCGGKLCKYKCKKDFYSVLCQDFTDTGQLTIVEAADIRKINVLSNQVRSIDFEKNNEITKVKTSSLVFSAGALKTPNLIKSLLPRNLLGAFYNQIGSGIAFHVSDFYLLYPKFRNSGSRNKIKILNGRLSQNFINDNTVRFTIQSVGAPIKKEYVQRFILRRLPNFLTKVPLVKTLIALLSKIAEWLGSNAHVLATVVEDPILKKNCVNFNKSLNPINITYKFEDDFISSIKKIDHQIKFLLRKKFFVAGLNGNCNLNYGHPMGGCAMGQEASFPVDENGRLKPFSNIFVADASIFPVSGDTNPSLTIAAVSFRTADQMLYKIWKESKKKVEARWKS